VISRCLIAAVTIFSWIALSNHCALSAIAAKPQTTHAGCPFHSKPVKVPPKSASTECCKILRAVTNAPVKNLAWSVVDLAPADFPSSDVIVFPPPKISFAPATLDTGPPGKTSFVELISSLRAHAPPVRA